MWYEKSSVLTRAHARSPPLRLRPTARWRCGNGNRPDFDELSQAVLAGKTHVHRPDTDGVSATDENEEYHILQDSQAAVASITNDGAVCETRSDSHHHALSDALRGFYLSILLYIHIITFSLGHTIQMHIIHCTGHALAHVSSPRLKVSAPTLIALTGYWVRLYITGYQHLLRESRNISPLRTSLPNLSR